MNDRTLQIDKKYKIFLKNGFRYLGKIESFDELFIKIHDDKTNNSILIPFKEVSTLEEVKF